MSLPEQDYVRARAFQRSHLLIMLFATVVTVLAAVGAVGLRPDAYASTADVIVKPEVINGVPMQPQMGTEAATAASGNVLRRAAQLLGATEADLRRGLSVSVPVDTTVVRIRFEASNPTAAFEGADAATRAYVDYRNGGSDARVAEVITQAGVPRGPGAVNYAVVVALAVLGGLILGVAAAAVWERVLHGARSGPTGLAPAAGPSWTPDASSDSAVELRTNSVGAQRESRLPGTSGEQ